MFSFRALLAAAPLLALAVAQNIAFTSTPGVAQAGQSYNISWAGGDGTGATLTLRRGSPQNLRTLDTLADGVTENFYVWTVPSSLESGDDYALQITQGQADINYSGLFSVTGGSASNSTSSTSVPAVLTTTGNSTMSITSAASASGTGTALERNSTFSTASLTSSSSGSTFGETTSSRTSASRTSTAATQSTSAPTTNGAENLAGSSSAALILGIVAAVMLH